MQGQGSVTLPINKEQDYKDVAAGRGGGVVLGTPWPLPPHMPSMRGTLMVLSSIPLSTSQFLTICICTHVDISTFVRLPQDMAKATSRPSQALCLHRALR